MGESVNPLVPAGYDVAWSIVFALAVVLTVVALVSIGRAAHQLSSLQALVWVLTVILVPVLGTIAWLWVGRKALPTPPHPGSAP